MFGFFKKAFRLYLSTYGEPGAGVVVYSAPDSIADIYRMRGVRMPLSQEPPKPAVGRHRASIWGGQGAAKMVTYRTAPCEPKPADC
jgi:hypothetical protein